MKKKIRLGKLFLSFHQIKIPAKIDRNMVIKLDECKTFERLPRTILGDGKSFKQNQPRLIDSFLVKVFMILKFSKTT